MWTSFFAWLWKQSAILFNIRAKNAPKSGNMPCSLFWWVVLKLCHTFISFILIFDLLGGKECNCLNWNTVDVQGHWTAWIRETHFDKTLRLNDHELCHNSKYTVEQKSLFLSGLKDLLLPKKNSIQKEKLKRGSSLRKGRGLMYSPPTGRSH